MNASDNKRITCLIIATPHVGTLQSTGNFSTAVSGATQDVAEHNLWLSMHLSQLTYSRFGLCGLKSR